MYITTVPLVVGLETILDGYNSQLREDGNLAIALAFDSALSLAGTPCSLESGRACACGSRVDQWGVSQSNSRAKPTPLVTIVDEVLYRP